MHGPFMAGASVDFGRTLHITVLNGFLTIVGKFLANTFAVLVLFAGLGSLKIPLR